MRSRKKRIAVFLVVALFIGIACPYNQREIKEMKAVENNVSYKDGDEIQPLSFVYLYYTGRVPPIRITTSKAKIAYNSGNTAITIVAPNTLWPAPTPAIPFAQTSA